MKNEDGLNQRRRLLQQVLDREDRADGTVLAALADGLQAVVDVLMAVVRMARSAVRLAPMA